MGCDRSRVSAYRDGLLSRAETRAFERHLAGCLTCQRTFAIYQRVGDAVRLLPVVVPPAELRRRTFNRVAERRDVRMPVWSAVALGFAGGVALMLTILLGWAALGMNATVPPMVAPPGGTAESTSAGSPTPVVASVPVVPTRTPTVDPVPTISAAPPAPFASPTPTSMAPIPSPTASPVRAAPTATSPPPLPTATVESSPTTAAPTRTATAGPATTSVTASPTARITTGATVTPAASPSPRAAGADPGGNAVVRAPLVTPTPGCPAPEGRIAATYSADAPLQAKLGCPTGPAMQVAGHEGAFQNGVMIRRADNRRVFALGPGTWATVVEAEGGRTTAALRPGEPAPPLLQAYRDSATVRELLGSATAEPRSVQLLVQPFERGTVIASDRRGLYVLYHDGRWEIAPER